ncbi:hypothetical protein ACK3TF_004073 [Chlorella vulgaris]
MQLQAHIKLAEGDEAVVESTATSGAVPPPQSLQGRPPSISPGLQPHTLQKKEGPGSNSALAAWEALLLAAAQDAEAAAAAGPTLPAARAPPAKRHQQAPAPTSRSTDELLWGSRKRRRQPHALSAAGGWVRHHSELPPVPAERWQPRLLMHKSLPIPTEQQQKQQYSGAHNASSHLFLGVEVQLVKVSSAAAKGGNQDLQRDLDVSTPRQPPPFLPDMISSDMPSLTREQAECCDVVVRQLSPLERLAAALLPQRAATLLAAAMPPAAATALTQVLQQATPLQGTTLLTLMLKRLLDAQGQGHFLEPLLTPQPTGSKAAELLQQGASSAASGESDLVAELLAQFPA